MAGTNDYLEFDEINPHLGLYQREVYQTAGDRAWDRFVNKVEKLVGREIDGDEGDGVALEYAYDAFRKGLTPDQYVRATRAAEEARALSASIRSGMNPPMEGK